VSLSDQQVKRLLNARFVCAWENTEGQPAAGASFAHSPRDPAPLCIRGNGEHNVQVLFLTPQGEIFHVLAGYVSPRDLQDELRFALANFAALTKAPRGSRQSVVTKAHEDMVKKLEKQSFSGPLGDWERRRAVADHRFAAKHPLLEVDSFRPEMLVGNGKSFFGSSTGGTPSSLIGTPEAQQLFEKIQQGQFPTDGSKNKDSRSSRRN
jgi:hypothetical protein